LLAAAALAVTAWFAAESVARAASTINVGNYLLLPNTSGQVIQIPVTGTDMAPGADLAVQVGDGGPQLSGTPGPEISQIGFSSGTIFSVAGATQSTPAGNIPQVWFTNVVLTGSTAYVPANGTLANITINTTGFSNGQFALLLSNVAPSLQPPNGISTDLTYQVPNLTINNGSITIIPSAAYWQGAVDGNWSTNSSGATNWRTDAGGATDTHTPPGVASDVLFSTASGGSNLTTTLDADFSIKGLTFTPNSASPVSIGGTHTLTLGADGMSLQSGAATATVGSAVTLGTSQTWSVNGANSLTVNGAVSIGGAMTLTKSGTGTLRVNSVPTIGNGGAIVVGAGTLRLGATSGAPTIGTGVMATVNDGATLELAGTTSALANGAARVNVTNNSQATVGGMFVSGTNQQIGNLDGTGNTAIGAGASFTANHVVQNALVIGGTAAAHSLVTIAASDSSGNSLGVASDLALSGSVTASSPVEVSSMDRLNRPLSSLSSAEASPVGNVGGGLGSGSAVPEPSTILLLIAGSLISVAHRWLAPRISGRTKQFC
jgi:hypothetical protein